MDYEIGIFRNHFHDIFQEALAEILKKKYIYIYIFKKLVQISGNNIKSNKFKDKSSSDRK